MPEDQRINKITLVLGFSGQILLSANIFDAMSGSQKVIADRVMRDISTSLLMIAMHWYLAFCINGGNAEMRVWTLLARMRTRFSAAVYNFAVKYYKP